MTTDDAFPGPPHGILADCADPDVFLGRLEETTQHLLDQADRIAETAWYRDFDIRAAARSDTHVVCPCWTCSHYGF